MTQPVTNQNILICKWQPELIRAMLDQGANVYLVLDRFDTFQDSTDTVLKDRCKHVYQVGSFDSLEELAAVAVDLQLRQAGIGYVLSHNELSQFGAGYLELVLGLPVADPAAHISHRDKRLMKQRVRERGVATAEFMSLPDLLDQALTAEVLQRMPKPFIVKPAAGYGGMSTIRVDTDEEFASLVQNFKFEPLLRSRQLIVEEFVAGTELAIDAIWVDGKALTFVVHRYHEPRLNMNEPSKMDGSRVLTPEDHPELYGRLRNLQDKVNTALGIRTCATHMEVFVRPDGKILFSEVATRIGGAWIPGLLSAYLGHDVWAMLAQATLVGTCPQPHPVAPYVASVHLRPLRPGVISAFPSDAELGAFPGVLSWRAVRRVGERARLNHPSDYYLHVIVGAESPGALEALCHRVMRLFAIETSAAR